MLVSRGVGHMTSHTTWLESDMGYKFKDLRLAWVTLTCLILKTWDLILVWDWRLQGQLKVLIFVDTGKLCFVFCFVFFKMAT